MVPKVAFPFQVEACQLDKQDTHMEAGTRDCTSCCKVVDRELVVPLVDGFETRIGGIIYSPKKQE